MTVLATVAAGAVVLFAASRDWQSIVTHQVPPLPPRTEHRTGSELSPWLPALGAVGLAGAGALLATRGRARTVVGGLLVLTGLGLLAAVIGALKPEVTPGWPVLTTVAALIVLAAGGRTVRRSGTWPEMGARYDRADPTPRQGTRAPQTELWDALDRGEDPTRDTPGEPGGGK